MFEVLGRIALGARSLPESSAKRIFATIASLKVVENVRFALTCRSAPDHFSRSL